MGTMREPKDGKIYKILMLTNRDSDNLGDQVMEACDIALIHLVMENLNISEDQYQIVSRAAGIIPKKYVATRDISLLKTAAKAISEADLLLFGGAPLFNYRYQVFYERTATTLEIAEHYQTPVLFSAIGVDSYDEDSEKCQRLKKTLNLPCVRQITTRDDLETLMKFRERESLRMDRVADPAVFSNIFFRDFITDKKENRTKKIGIFVLRRGGFTDNGVPFSGGDEAALWRDLVRELQKKGYDYELLTSGHFGDEAFLDSLVVKYNMNVNKCTFNMNAPEQLIRKISSFDAVVSTRLHPSILSYSLGIPSVGLTWNEKVSNFYNGIGYPERAMRVQGITAAAIADRLEEAMQQGVNRDESYMMSVYNTLLSGIQSVFMGKETAPWTYEEICQKAESIPPVSAKEQQEKLRRKFRRTYAKYNDISDLYTTEKEKVKELKSELAVSRSRESILSRARRKGIRASVSSVLKRIRFAKD